MKVSRVFVTHNERDRTLLAQDEMFHRGDGAFIHETLMADSASTDGAGVWTAQVWNPDVFIQFKTNLGIARSHNPLFAMASGDIIVLTGCNRVPPKGWAKLFKTYFEYIPELAALCIYNEGVDATQRDFGGAHIQWIHGEKGAECLHVKTGVLMDCIAWRREVFKEIGYYQECFGMYGVEDLEFSARVHRWCKENGKFAGFIPGLRNKHYGFDPRIPHDPATSSKAYYDLKKAEVDRFPEKEKRFNELRDKNFPYFSPF